MIWRYMNISIKFVKTFSIVSGLLTLVFAILQALILAEENSIWVLTNQLPDRPQFNGVSRHAAIAHKDTIYVIGGGKDLVVQSKDIYHSKIRNNGTLSVWTKIKPLTNTLIYAPAVVSKESCIYLVGGRSGEEAQSSTLIGRLNFNGEIDWQEKNISEFTARYLHSLVISDNKLYALGGFRDHGGDRVIGVVDFLKLSNNCKTSADHKWTQTTSLSPSRAAHASIAFEGKIYVIGGFVNGDRRQNISSSVQMATVQDSGLSSWTPLTVTPPIPLAYHTAVVSKATRRIYIFGGLKQNGKLSSKVYSAYIEADGQLSGDPDNPTKWLEESELELPVPLYRHTAVLASNGSIYVIGGQTKTQSGSDINQSQVYFTPPLSLSKSSEPTGSIHEGDMITYTISYANTSFIAQTMTITDVIPFNVELIPDSISDDGQVSGSTIAWNLGDVSPGHSGQVSFQVKIPLFLNSEKTSVPLDMMAASSNAAYILPGVVKCDTTQFWAVGATSLSKLEFHTIRLQIPPNTKPSEMWLLMKYTNNVTPTVSGQPAQLVTINNNSFGASLWTATIPQSALDNGQLTIVTQNPRNLNAIFLFDKSDPPFVKEELEAFQNTTKTFTYTLDIPSVTTQTIDIIMPFMDITDYRDNGQLDPRLTTITVKYNNQVLRPFTVNTSNQGNGLVMAQFPIDIGPISGNITSTATVAVTVDTEDSVYTLGPRICRPVYIANTAWLCSKQAGCISDTIINKPSNLKYPVELFLPIINKKVS